MIRSASLLILALTLGGCCMSGNCYAPMAASNPGPMVAATPAARPASIAGGADLPSANPDGLVTTSAYDDQEEYLPPSGKKAAGSKKNGTSRSYGDATPRSRGEQAYEEQLAADRADDERLKRKLMICQNCQSKGNADN
ncbi:MAG: hypothetical protein JOY90_18950 [Bradyrhizobium sp.]|uniref:hypothetical protein n=1 Tax=Bradyrhizobium sp. TaxID=376 RepID=UPI001D9D82A2|nr:hypothetical protein [Bradyrhizobium sp.]MBV9562496.1 hypothetical protein [Bradyrhizobium sp.]